VELIDLKEWVRKIITGEDALAVEATANAFQVYDTLLPHAHSVTVVHPPHLAVIVKAPVKTDRKAAYELARLLAKDMLEGIWVPPQEIRDLRTLVAQRRKMASLKRLAKNRLQGVLHRYSIPLPDGPLFSPEQKSWWMSLPVTALELVKVRSDWDSLDFAQAQINYLEEEIGTWAAKDERVPILFELCGLGLITAVTLLAGVGDIHRFPDADHLVGYSGLGVRIHDSGMTSHTGGITKAGRREMRAALVEAAQVAVLHDPRWKSELARLEPRIGRNKAIVAIARKMLVIVWHILSKREAEKHLNLERLARKYYEFAYTVDKKNWGDCKTALAFIRQKLDQAGVGQEMSSFFYGGRRIDLPPSTSPPAATK
jgi:transposase